MRMSKNNKKHENELVAAAIAEYLTAADKSEASAGIQLSGGGAVAALERKLAEYFQMKHALSVASATVGLFILGLGLDFKKAEFVTSPLTFGGTVASWLLLGNKSVFSDIDAQTLTLDPDAVRACVTEETKAILAVDIFGNPCDTNTLRNIADEYGLFYIADCAQSFGASRDGLPTNHFADAIVVSFTAGKTLFAGEGGAVLTDNTELYHKLIWFSQHPFRQQKELGLGLANEFSFNGRIHPLAAIWANTCFDTSLSSLRQRQVDCFRVIESLNDSSLTEQITFAKQHICPSFFRLTAELKRPETEDELVDYLSERGIQATISQVPASLIYHQPAFKIQYQEQFCLPAPCRVAERQMRKRIVINLQRQEKE